MKTPPARWRGHKRKKINSKSNYTGIGFYKSPQFTSNRTTRHKKALSLTGKPLNPEILKNRERKLLQEERSKRETRSFFYKLSKQFSEASKLHFGDNPGRRIKTNHLKFRARNPSNYEPSFSQIIETASDLGKPTTGGDSDLLNQTVRLDETNLYGIINRANPKSEVLDLPQQFKEPSKLIQIVQIIRGK